MWLHWKFPKKCTLNTWMHLMHLINQKTTWLTWLHHKGVYAPAELLPLRWMRMLTDSFLQVFQTALVVLLHRSDSLSLVQPLSLWSWCRVYMTVCPQTPSSHHTHSLQKYVCALYIVINLSDALRVPQRAAERFFSPGEDVVVRMVERWKNWGDKNVVWQMWTCLTHFPSGRR